MKKIITSILCIALCLGLLSGCGSKSAVYASDSKMAYTSSSTTSAAAPGSARGSYGYDDGAYYAEDYSYENAVENLGGTYDDGVIIEQNESLKGRKLIKNVAMSLETLTYDDTIKKIENEVNRLGGYIQDSYENNNNSYYNYYYDSTSMRNNRNSSYTIRIPSEKLNAFINAIGDLGTILHQSLSTQDVTLEYVDTEARAEALQIQLDRLLAILEKAETVEDIITLESRISDVTYQLERKESVLKNYDNLVEFSTISLSVQEVQHYTVPEKEPETVGQRIVQGLSETFYDIGEGFKDFIVGFLVDLPYILIWGVIIAAVVFVIIKITRKRRLKKVQRKAQEDAVRKTAYEQSNTNEASE